MAGQGQLLLWLMQKETIGDKNTSIVNVSDDYSIKNENETICRSRFQ